MADTFSDPDHEACADPNGPDTVRKVGTPVEIVAFGPILLLQTRGGIIVFADEAMATCLNI